MHLPLCALLGAVRGRGRRNLISFRMIAPITATARAFSTCLEVHMVIPGIIQRAESILCPNPVRSRGIRISLRLRLRKTEQCDRVPLVHGPSLIIWLGGSAVPGTGKIRVRNPRPRPQECRNAREPCAAVGLPVRQGSWDVGPIWPMATAGVSDLRGIPV
eukprot:scaffold30658_cov146-Isochrysis_galbana.AAC.2